MTLEDCYQLGYIIKPHGLKGEVQVLLDADHPEEYVEMESVFVLQGQNLVPFFLEHISVNQDKALVKFEEIDDIDSAKAIKGMELYLPLSSLPELEGDEFYYHELEGVSVIPEGMDAIGVIKNLIDSGQQKLLSLSHHSGKEILLPYHEELVISFDRKKKELVLKVPDGLVDIYLSD